MRRGEGLRLPLDDYLVLRKQQVREETNDIVCRIRRQWKAVGNTKTEERK